MVDNRIKDFKNFLYMAWKHLNLPQPTPLQYDISDYLQDENERRVVIEAFRGVVKVMDYIGLCLSPTVAESTKKHPSGIGI